jgi:hypothetical protein
MMIIKTNKLFTNKNIGIRMSLSKYKKIIKEMQKMKIKNGIIKNGNIKNQQNSS